MAYAFFDGDGIGSKLEILLIEGKIAEASNFSESLKYALDTIIFDLKNNIHIKIILFGGDDLLFEFDNQINEEFFESIRNKYYQMTGVTFSCGVGNSIQESIRNLYFAKLYGKNQIYSDHGL